MNIPFISFSKPEYIRYLKYKEILSKEKRTWNKDHYHIKSLLNIVSISILFKIFSINLKRFYFKFGNHSFTNILIKSILLGSSSILIFIFTYVYLPRIIYFNYYSSSLINDDDFEDFYEDTIVYSKINRNI